MVRSTGRHACVQASAAEGSLLGFAHALADLVQLTHQGTPQDLGSTQQVLLQATSDLLSGHYTGLAFVRKVSGLLLHAGTCICLLLLTILMPTKTVLCWA